MKDYDEREFVIQKMVSQIMSHSQILKNVLEVSGNWTLEQYVEEAANFNASKPLSPPEDVAILASLQLAPLLGEEIAEKAAGCLVDVALTATHHGVDTFAPSVQGHVLYKRLLEKRGTFADVVPVLAFGSVSLSNDTFGRGLLIYETNSRDYPYKFPIIPSKYQNSVVSFFPAVTADMLKKSLFLAKKRLLASECDAVCAQEVAQAVFHVIGDVYSAPEVLAQDAYIKQATIVNASLSQESCGFTACYVDAERLAAEILLRDFSDALSLAALVLRDCTFRKGIYQTLDGVNGCWQRGTLTKRRMCARGGTMLFWGRDPKLYKRAAMVGDNEALINIKTGERIPYEAVPEALAQGKLIPGLFMTFLVLLFARGFRCFGGYFQGDYLKAMQRGLVFVLKACGKFALAEVVASRQTDGYLSGPMFLEGAGGAPYGRLEMLTYPAWRDSLEEALRITLSQAHRIGFRALYETVVPPKERIALNWQIREGAK